MNKLETKRYIKVKEQILDSLKKYWIELQNRVEDSLIYSLIRQNFWHLLWSDAGRVRHIACVYIEYYVIKDHRIKTRNYILPMKENKYLETLKQPERYLCNKYKVSNITLA